MSDTTITTTTIPDTTITITKVEILDPTAYSADHIHLSDGRVILAWNGAPSYDVRDEVTGPVEEGSLLTSVTAKVSYYGENYDVFHFAPQPEPHDLNPTT